MRAPHLALTVALASALFGSSGRAHAQQDDPTHARTSSLSWVRLPGAESCVPTQDLARDVETRLARPVFVSASQGDVSIEGRIERRAQKWHAVIVMRDSKGATIGTRELDRAEPSCDGMRESLTLVLAVMIDPDAALAKPAPPPPNDPTPPPSAPTAAPPATTTAPPPPSDAPVIEPRPNPPLGRPTPDPLYFEASASMLGAAGLTPSLAPGFGLNSLIEVPHIPIALDGVIGVFLDSNADATAGDGRKASTAFTLAYLGGGLCPLRFRSERVHVFGCLVSELGVLRARSQGFESGEDKLGVLYNIGIEGRMSLRIAGPFALRAGVSGVVPLVRSSFTYDKGDGTSAQLFQASAVAATGDLGLGFLFP